MKRVLVTGATGFIGSHVTQALLRHGYNVRAMVRPGHIGPPTHPNLSVVTGDVRDPSSITSAIDGCHSVIHTAAIYSFWTPESTMWQTNVEGTRNVLQSALNAGVERIIHTSTVSTVGLRSDGTPSDETRFATAKELAGPYKRTKFEAERIALEFAQQGAPVVVVNPTTPVGPGDGKPTPTGQVILDFLRRSMPAYIDTGLNWVDVADVAQGHVLALEKGRIGERYLLGNPQGNLTLKAMFELLAEVTGLLAPKRCIPWSVAIAAAHLDRFIEGTLLRRRPRIPLEGTRMARKPMWVDCSKAVAELGLPQQPVKAALRRAADWFVHQGYTSTHIGQSSAVRHNRLPNSKP